MDAISNTMLKKLADYFISKNYSAEIIEDKVHCEIVTCADIIIENGQYKDKIYSKIYNSVEEVELSLLDSSKIKADTARQYYKNNKVFLNIIDEDNEKKLISDKTVDLGYFADLARIHGLISSDKYYSYNIYCYRVLNGYEKFNPERYENLRNLLIEKGISID